MTSRVEGFRIVLADGTLMNVVRPVDDETSQLNNDLYWAVLGGASGSWGVITEITLKPRMDADYFSVYGTTAWLFEEEGVVGLFRRFAEMANANKDDGRWSVVLNAYNTDDMRVVSVETAWVAPMEEAGDYDPALFQSLLDSCTGCVPVFSAAPVAEPLSFSLRFKYVRNQQHQSSPRSLLTYPILVSLCRFSCKKQPRRGSPLTHSTVQL